MEDSSLVEIKEDELGMIEAPEEFNIPMEEIQADDKSEEEDEEEAMELEVCAIEDNSRPEDLMDNFDSIESGIEKVEVENSEIEEEKENNCKELREMNSKGVREEEELNSVKNTVKSMQRMMGLESTDGIEKNVDANSSGITANSPSNYCKSCNKKVYKMEEINAKSFIFHKKCFKCIKCDKLLSPENYVSANNDEFYCQLHYKKHKLFLKISNEFGENQENKFILNSSESNEDDMNVLNGLNNVVKEKFNMFENLIKNEVQNSGNKNFRNEGNKVRRSLKKICFNNNNEKEVSIIEEKGEKKDFDKDEDVLVFNIKKEIDPLNSNHSLNMYNINRTRELKKFFESNKSPSKFNNNKDNNENIDSSQEDDEENNNVRSYDSLDEGRNNSLKSEISSVISTTKLREKFESPTIEKEKEVPNQQQIEANNKSSPKNRIQSLTPTKNNTSLTSTTGMSDNCAMCEKKVYVMEKVEAGGKMYHKNCFKCSQCKCFLRMDTYTTNKGVLFCKTHFKQLFKIKGNYDEGFGHETQKQQWLKKKQAEGKE